MSRAATALFLLLAARAVEAAPLTLPDAMAEAMRGNLALRGVTLDMDRAEEGLRAARGGFDPTLSASLGAGADLSLSNSVLDGGSTVASRSLGWSAAVNQLLPTGGTASLSWSELTSSNDSDVTVLQQSTSASAALSLRQPLLDGLGPLAARAEVRAAQRSLADAQLALRAAAEAVASQVSDAYWSLVAAREQAELARRSLKIAEDELAATLERQAEGFVGSGPVLQVQRAVGVARQAVVVAEADQADRESALAAVLGRPLLGRETIEPVDRPVVPDTDPDLEAAMTAARAGNAAWRRAELASQQAEDDAAQARQGALPDLGLSASVGWSGLGADPQQARDGVREGSYRSWGLGADLSVPLGGRANIAALQDARAAEQQAALDLEAAEQALVLEVESAVRAVARDRARERLAGETLEAARAGLEAEQELLAEGRGAVRDVILALEDLDDASVGKLQAEIDLQASLLDLARIEGRLLELLGLAVR